MKLTTLFVSAALSFGLSTAAFAVPSGSGDFDAILSSKINAKKYSNSTKVAVLNPVLNRYCNTIAGKWGVSGTNAQGNAIYSGMVYAKRSRGGRYMLIKYYAATVGIKGSNINKRRKAFMVMRFPNGSNKYVISSFLPNGHLKNYIGTVQQNSTGFLLSSNIINTPRGKMRIFFTVHPINKRQYMQKFYVVTAKDNSGLQLTPNLKPKVYMLYTKVSGKRYQYSKKNK